MFVEDRADLERKPISCVLSCTDNVWLDSKFKPGGGFFWFFFFFFVANLDAGRRKYVEVRTFTRAEFPQCG